MLALEVCVALYCLIKISVAGFLIVLLLLLLLFSNVLCAWISIRTSPNFAVI